MTRLFVVDQRPTSPSCCLSTWMPEKGRQALFSTSNASPTFRCNELRKHRERKREKKREMERGREGERELEREKGVSLTLPGDHAIKLS